MTPPIHMSWVTMARAPLVMGRLHVMGQKGEVLGQGQVQDVMGVRRVYHRRQQVLQHRLGRLYEVFTCQCRRLVVWMVYQYSPDREPTWR